MAKKFYNAIRLVKLTSDPPSVAESDLWYDDTSDKLKMRNASASVKQMDELDAIQEFEFTYQSTLAVYTGTARRYMNYAYTILDVRASVGTQPTGAAILVDVNKNGTTIFTGGTDRPNIAVSTSDDIGTPAVTSLASGDYLTVDIDQIGSTIAGADLVVIVRARRTI